MHDGVSSCPWRMGTRTHCDPGIFMTHKGPARGQQQPTGRHWDTPQDKTHACNRLPPYGHLGLGTINGWPEKAIIKRECLDLDRHRMIQSRQTDP